MSQNVGFDESKLQQIQGNVLTRDERLDLIPRMSCKRDFSRRVFDGDLLDAIKTLHYSEDTMRPIIDSAKDENCTKQFYNTERMMDHFKEFLTSEKRDARYSKEMRAVRVLLLKYLPTCDLHPRALDESLVEEFSNKSGAAGAISRLHKDEAASKCLEVAKRITLMLKVGEHFRFVSIPTMCYHRAQISDLLTEEGEFNASYKSKDRAVEGVDGGTLLVEMMFFLPIYQLLKERFDSYAGGKSPEKMRMMVRSWRREFGWWIGSDFSKFDCHLPSWCIYFAFDVLKEKYFSHLANTEEKYYDWVAYNFVNTQMIDPMGNVVIKHKGIPSGSYCTQPIGTLCNITMNLAAICHLSGKRTVHEMVDFVEKMVLSGNSKSLALSAMGDDCLIFLRLKLDDFVVQRWSDYITKTFGVEMQWKKTAFGSHSKTPEYLKREWRDYGEWQDPRKLWINVIHNEYPRKYDTYSPWHIIYGLFLTYRASFPGWVSMKYLVEKMKHSTGGLEALRRLPTHEMPGVFRGLGEDVGNWLYDNAVCYN